MHGHARIRKIESNDVVGNDILSVNGNPMGIPWNENKTPTWEWEWEGVGMNVAYIGMGMTTIPYSPGSATSGLRFVHRCTIPSTEVTF